MKLSGEEQVVILGQGIAGLSLAFRMIQRGYQPTLIGSSRLPKNASRCAQGVLANKGLIFFESPLFAAKLKSLRHIQDWLTELEDASGMLIPRCFEGVFEPYWDSEEFQSLVSRIYRRQFWGCFGTVNLTASSWPSIEFCSNIPKGFLFYPRDGWFDVEATLNALRHVLKKAEVRVIEDEIDHVFKQADHSFQLTTSAGVKLKADRLILATGVGTPQLLDQLNVPKIKSFVIGGQTVKVTLPFHTEKAKTFVRGTLTATWIDHTLIIGSSSWKGAHLEREAVEMDTKALLKEADRKFGWNLSDGGFSVEVRAAARFRYADRMPAVGPSKYQNFPEHLYFLNGFYKNGIHLADLCSLDLLAYLEDRISDVLYPEFTPDRLIKVSHQCNPQV